MNCLCYDFQFYVVMAHAKIDCDFVQVEFNKASQSLTEAVFSSVQKKTALNRLSKARPQLFTSFGSMKKSFGGGGETLHLFQFNEEKLWR